jgi:hypothetical protein
MRTFLSRSRSKPKFNHDRSINQPQVAHDAEKSSSLISRYRKPHDAEEQDPVWIGEASSEYQIGQECLALQGSVGLNSNNDLAHCEPWPLLCPNDAFDALDLVRPATMQFGLVLMGLTEAFEVLVTLAVNRAPAHDIRVALSLVPQLPLKEQVTGIIVGIVRCESTQLRDRWGLPIVQLFPEESEAWLDAARTVRSMDMHLHDVIIIEPDRWVSLADCAGVEFYDEQHVDGNHDHWENDNCPDNPPISDPTANERTYAARCNPNWEVIDDSYSEPEPEPS